MDKRVPYTRRMLGAVQRIGVCVSHRIVREGPPVVGALYFDERDKLVLVTEASDDTDPLCRIYGWRRVYTNRELSRDTYRGRVVEMRGRSLVKGVRD